jgi:hypothetical protein
MSRINANQHFRLISIRQSTVLLSVYVLVLLGLLTRLPSLLARRDLVRGPLNSLGLREWSSQQNRRTEIVGLHLAREPAAPSL